MYRLSSWIYHLASPFVRLLVVEVHHLEIVIVRLWAASRWLSSATVGPGSFAIYALKNLLLGNQYREWFKNRTLDSILLILETIGRPCGVVLER